MQQCINCRLNIEIKIWKGTETSTKWREYLDLKKICDFALRDVAYLRESINTYLPILAWYDMSQMPGGESVYHMSQMPGGKDVSSGQT